MSYICCFYFIKLRIAEIATDIEEEETIYAQNQLQLFDF